MKLDNFYKIKSFLFENRETKQIVMKNTLWLTISAIFSKLFKYFLLIYAARLLGVTQYGYFNFAMSFAALFAIFADLGISNLISRDLARDKETEIKIPAIFTLKILLVLASFLLITLFSFLVPQTDHLRLAIILMAIFVTVNSLSIFLYYCFYGREEMQYQTITEIIENGFAAAFGIYLLLRSPTAINLTFAYALSSLVGFTTIYLIFNKRFGKILRFQIDFTEWKRVIALAWPLALAGVFSLIYTYTDTVMLGFWRLFDQVGYYNAAQKIIALAIFPSYLIVTAFLPTFSRYVNSDHKKSQTIFNYQNIILLAIALPLLIGGLLIAQGLIIHFYGIYYLPAVLALKILLVMVVFSYLSTSFGYALFVCNQQKRMFLAYLGGTLLNIPLNILLIPRFGLYGASIATVLTSLITLLVMIFLVKKFTFLEIINSYFLKFFLLILLASATMGIILLCGAKYNINVFLKIVLAIIIYGLFLIRFISNLDSKISEIQTSKK